MKRKLLTIILMVTLSITLLTKCGNKENKEKIIFDTLIVEDVLTPYYSLQRAYIVYDKNTKVKYLFYIGDSNSGITPLYNADGTVQIHKD